MTEPWGCYYCHLGVLTQVFGSLASHKPSTSAVSVPLSRKHIQNAQCCLFFHKHASRPIWRTLSYCDFIYLTATGQTTTSSPWTWYWVKHGLQLFGSKLWGWDKLLVWCESLAVYLVYLCNPQCGPVTHTHTHTHIYIYIYIYIYIIYIYIYIQLVFTCFSVYIGLHIGLILPRSCLLFWTIPLRKGETLWRRDPLLWGDLGLSLESLSLALVLELSLSCGPRWLRFIHRQPGYIMCITSITVDTN